jgi:hypothetical protein
MNERHQPGLFIGIDWADRKHDCYVIDRDGKGFHQELSHSPEDIDTWVGEMLKRAAGKPIAIMLEQSRGPLVHALMFRKNVLLFPINPKQCKYDDLSTRSHNLIGLTGAHLVTVPPREWLETSGTFTLSAAAGRHPKKRDTRRFLCDQTLARASMVMVWI